METNEDKPTLNCVSLFSGIEAFSVAASRIKDVKWNMVFFSEIDQFPCEVLKYHYPDVPNLGDICKIKADSEKGIITNGLTTIPFPKDGIDILAGGSPCFVAGTMVLTPSGYVPIETLKVGDEVISGSGKIQKVEAIGSKLAEVGELKILGRPKITCTPNHPFFCVNMKRDERRDSKTYARKIAVGDFAATPAEESVGKYAGRIAFENLPQFDIQFPKVGSATERDIMELAGWYVGDGYIRKFTDTAKKTVTFALCNERQMTDFQNRFGKLVHISHADKGKLIICCTELADWLLEHFGEHALEKHIPYWCYGHSDKDAFLKGYFATDGCQYGNEQRFVTVSAALAHGLADMLGDASISLNKVSPKTIIEGREVNQHDWYKITSTPKPIRTKYINGRYASIVRSYATTGTVQRVYNITVGDEHTYIANGLWVHNCQSVSIAGKRHGMAEGSGTRSSLAFEYSRLVEELRPRILLWENVFGVLSSNQGRDFLAFQHSLVKRGYGVCWRVLDAQYTRVAGFPRAIPQRRRRVFLVGVRTVGRSGITPEGIAQILFEQPSLLGNTPPRRETGKGFAAPVGYCLEGNDSLVGSPRKVGGFYPYEPGGVKTCSNEVSPTVIDGSCPGFQNGVVEGLTITGADVSPSIIASDYKGPGNTQDGKCVVAPLEKDCCPTIDASYPGHMNFQDLDKLPITPAPNSFMASSFGTFKKEEVSGTLDCDHCNGTANGTPGLIAEPMVSDKEKTSCLTPEHPMTHRVYEDNGAFPTIMSGHDSGQDMRAVLTKAEEPMAFSQNQREEVRDLGQASGAIPAEDGSHQRTMICCNSPQLHSTTRGYGIEVAPTMGAAAGESGNNKPFAAIESGGGKPETESVGIGRDAYNMGSNAKFGMSVDNELSPPIIARGPNALATNVTTYENHAQDSRVQPIDVMPTMGHSNANSPGVSGNNPLVVVKDSTAPESAVAIDQQGGKGMAATAEEVLPTMASDSHGTPHAVCTTNSNVEDVMPTILADEYKMTQPQKDRSGGYVMQLLF